MKMIMQKRYDLSNVLISYVSTILEYQCAVRNTCRVRPESYEQLLAQVCEGCPSLLPQPYLSCKFEVADC